MTLVLIAGPAEEPVTLAETRAYLRLDGTQEDALVTALTAAARTMLEAETRRAFVTQSWRLLLDAWPAGGVEIPLAPVRAVTAIALVNGEGAQVPVDPALYEADIHAEPPRIVPGCASIWPPPLRRVAGIAIEFEAGYGAAQAVPAPLKQALLMLVAHWFENRAPVAFGGGVSELPMAAAALIAPYRRLHL